MTADPATVNEGRRLVRTNLPRNLHWNLASDLASRILSGEFAPEEPLPRENELLADYGVSRTVLREALKTLGAKGLVLPKPKTGTHVRSRNHWNLLDPDVMAWRFLLEPTEQFARDLTEIRLLIEPPAASLAAVRATQADLGLLRGLHRTMIETAGVQHETFIDADMRFHGAMLAATHNELLQQMTSPIEGALIASRLLTHDHPGGPNHALELHTHTLDAVASRDPQKAEMYMRQLVTDALDDLLQVSARRHSE